MAEVKVRALENGPYIVEGPITLIDPTGNQVPTKKNVVALCRCGGSTTKPFCDGTHSKIGFAAAEAAVAAEEDETEE